MVGDPALVKGYFCGGFMVGETYLLEMHFEKLGKGLGGILNAQLFSQVFSVKAHRVGRDIEMLGDLLGCHAASDHAGDLEFGFCEAEFFGGNGVGLRRQEALKVFNDQVDGLPVHISGQVSFEGMKIRNDQPVEIGYEILPYIRDLAGPLIQQDLEGVIDLFQFL